jgi:four helix bundle protein
MSFQAHDLAREMIESLRPALESLKRSDPDLAKQLRRAAPSVLLNLGEGSRRVGADRLHHYRIAAGSAAEVRDVIFVARSWRYVDAALVERADALLDKILAILWTLTNRGGG